MKASFKTTILDVTVYHCIGGEEEHYCTDTNGYLALQFFLNKNGAAGIHGSAVYYRKIPVMCNLNLDKGGPHAASPLNAHGCKAEEVVP